MSNFAVMKKPDKNSNIEFLRQNRTLLEDKYGVVKTGLIGSYSRNVQTDESAIDFLVEYKNVSFKNTAGLYIFLEESFKKKPDIVIDNIYLRPRFRSIIENDLKYSYRKNSELPFVNSGKV